MEEPPIGRLDEDSGDVSDGLPTVEIRAATTEDGPLLEDLLHLALHVPEGAEPFPRSVLEQPELRRYVDGFGQAVGDVGRVAVVGGAEVGACWGRVMEADAPGYGWVADDVAELTIALRPQWRGLGIGRRLIDEVLSALAARGDRRASLSVDPASPAVALYERCGFRPVGRNGTSITMVRDLDWR